MPAPLPARLRADLFAQLAAMEQAGLPADRAWGLLKIPGVPAARMQSVQKALTRGHNLAAAAQNTGLFTAMEGNLVRAALLAGSPLLAYQRLAASCASKAQNEAAVRSRMLLPMVILVLALLIHPLPQLITGSLTGLAYLAQVLKPLLAFALVALLAKQLLARGQQHRWLLQLPLVGEAMARSHARDFFESLALLLEAGVPMFEALPPAVDTIAHTGMRRVYAGIKPLMVRGAPLSEAITSQITDPVYQGAPQVTEFITTGEASGTLPEMLLRHTRMETERLNLFYQQLAQWLPRIAYAAIALWIAYGLLTGGGIVSRMPEGI